jgi:PAS domain S-box-containing protein
MAPSPSGKPEDAFRAQSVASLINASDDAIIGKDLNATIVFWNRGAERLYGYAAEEAVGKSMSLIVPPDRAAEPMEIVRRTLDGEFIDHYETVRIAKDGRQVHVHLVVTLVRDEKGEVCGMLTLARDVTRQREAERSLANMREQEAQRNLIMATANRVALDILSSTTGVEALKHIAEAARELAGASYAALGVARLDGQGLIEFVTCGLTDEDEKKIGARPRGAGVLGMLLERNEPLRIDVLGSHPNSVGFPPNHPAMDTFLGVPIRSGSTVVGSLYLTNKIGGGPFTDADVLAVEALGAHAAVAIQNMHSITRQRTLVSGLIAAQEEERRTVAYDLHDGLTQFVMAAHAHLQAFRKATAAGRTEKAERELDQGLKYLKEAVVESRRLVSGLRTLALDDIGLAGALEQLVSEEKARCGWNEAEFLHNIAGVRFHKNLETVVYRVVQEALSNIRKHAGAGQVHIVVLADFESEQPYISVEIQDWGKGFETGQQFGADHVGLQSMVERVRLVNGKFTLTSTPGEGTRIRAQFPIVEPAEEADR